jgi:hypothetical protein
MVSNISAQGSQKLANFVRDDIKSFDASVVANGYQEIMRFLIDINFGTDEPMAEVELVNPRDILRKLARDKDFTAIGVKFNEDYFEEEYSLDNRYFSVVDSDVRTQEEEDKEKENQSDKDEKRLDNRAEENGEYRNT